MKKRSARKGKKNSRKGQENVQSVGEVIRKYYPHLIKKLSEYNENRA